jgi:hypothetical protein
MASWKLSYFIKISNNIGNILHELLIMKREKIERRKNELCHDKTNVKSLQPAWIQTSLRIRAV